ncbi:MAG: hypothetical protein KDN18_09430 [Verrucomicrobiae bacterium]|nr:hypothetical protein [Verrucomicrobiae bacterium]
MKARLLPLAFLWIGLVPPLWSQTPEDTSKKRTWTSNDGRTIEASFEGAEGDKVRLRLANGTIATVPLERLSKEDAAFVKAQATATASGTGTNPPASKEWPRSIDIGATPDPETVTEDPEKKEFVYRSGHYEFHCDSKLTSTVVREFSRIFEATYLLNCSLPLDLKPMPEDDGQEFFVARLYTTREDYLANGGLEGSGGVYQRSKKSLAVPLGSLGVKIQGSRVLLENSGNDDDNKTLIHEITHQMMNHWLPKLRTWYVEGSAEAVEMIEYDRGKFNLASRKSRLEDYVDRGGGDGKNFRMLDPGELFGLDSRTWAAALTSIRGQATQNYHSAGLMAYYFYYLDGDGDGANLIAYLRELENVEREFKTAETAAFEKHLLRGRTNDQLKEDLTKAFRGEGIALTFDEPGKNQAFTSPE